MFLKLSNFNYFDLFINDQFNLVVLKLNFRPTPTN